MSQREEIGVPRGSPEIEIDGVRLAVAREGRGPALVCLHAVGHGGRDFEAFTALVRERFEVIRVDWPGQGRSAADIEPPSAARYAQLLQGLLDRLGVTAPIIIGCSIGGAAAIRYATARPVRALVLCDPGGLLEVTPFTRRFCRAFAWFFAAGERRAWWYRSAFRAYYRLVLPMSAAADQRRRITDAAFEIGGLLRRAWQGFGQPESDLRAMAAALNVPVWFAWGQRDRIIQLRHAKPAIDRMVDARITLFDAGHAAFLEQPERFAEAFFAFAGALRPPGDVTPLTARRA